MSFLLKALILKHIVSKTTSIRFIYFSMQNIFSLKFLIKASLLLSTIILFSSATKDDRFNEVLEHIKERTLRKQLEAFRNAGIEKEVDTLEYDADKVIAYAKTFMGTKHKMRGSGKSGIDCSGLVMVSHKKYGIYLPHSAQEQARYGKIIPHMDELQKGDLVFFCHSYATGRVITHSGVYLGNDKFIHASNDYGVIISSIQDPYYWKKKFLFGTRF